MNRDEWATCIDVLRGRLSTDDVLARSALNLIEIDAKRLLGAESSKLSTGAVARLLGHRAAKG